MATATEILEIPIAGMTCDQCVKTSDRCLECGSRSGIGQRRSREGPRPGER